MQYPPNDQTGTNYPQWEPQPRPQYEQGYRPPQPYYPPPQPYYPPQYPQQPIPYPPPYYQPYPPQQQPPYYPPQQIMMMNNTYNMRTQQHGGLARLLYFLFIGWWLALLWLSIAVTLICTIIGAPVGFVMLNQLPAILTLQKH